MVHAISLLGQVVAILSRGAFLHLVALKHQAELYSNRYSSWGPHDLRRLHLPMQVAPACP
jgi:hypothetical protein